MAHRVGVVERAFLEQAFELRFLKEKGAAFQSLFNELMERAYPGDFQAVRPWGNEGDRKNDGYWRSEETLFQVYGPNTLTKSDTIAKIDEDLAGAKHHWGGRFRRWVLVHNNRDGAPAWLLEKQLTLAEDNPDITIELWGFSELHTIAFNFDQDDLFALLGVPPTRAQISGVRYEALISVLHAIGQTPLPVDSDFEPVPTDKLSANALGEGASALIEAGMKGTPRVERFFHEWHNPRFADEVATAFKSRYAELRASGLTPDRIFTELYAFAGGPSASTPEESAAVIAMLSYLFWACDIFERPRALEP